ncbi:MAG: hypothetical protein RL757_454 [Bacteroidota bacterium]|jgi:hypothetical protein
MKKTIHVKDTEVTLLSREGGDDYISLTDIALSFDNDTAIHSWMRNKNTVEYIGIWEQLHNPNFKGDAFVTFKNEAGLNRFNLTPKKWIDATDAIGMISKAGRYGGGIFAHQDLAIHFCAWLDATFYLFLVKEFRRLKEEEIQKNLELGDWNLKRTLSKVNYVLHSDAVQKHLIPEKVKNTQFEGIYYASEADLLNIALFGITAKQWREENPEQKGNMRDFATATQLLVLSNLENLNAEFIKMGMKKEIRLEKLNETAIYQMRILIESNEVKKLLE